MDADEIQDALESFLPIAISEQRQNIIIVVIIVKRADIGYVLTPSVQIPLHLHLSLDLSISSQQAVYAPLHSALYGKLCTGRRTSLCKSIGESVRFVNI